MQIEQKTLLIGDKKKIGLSIEALFIKPLKKIEHLSVNVLL